MSELITSERIHEQDIYSIPVDSYDSEMHESNLWLPGFTYLTKQSVRHARRSAYGSIIISTLLSPKEEGSYVTEFPLDVDVMKMENMNKAYCLGMTAVSYGAEKVGVVDLSKADMLTQREHLTDLMAEISVTDAQLFILAGPDADTAMNNNISTVEKILGARSNDFPTLVAGTNTVRTLDTSQSD